MGPISANFILTHTRETPEHHVERAVRNFNDVVLVHTHLPFSSLGWKTLMSFLPYGHAWRARRRAFWQEFNPERSTNHRPKQLWYSRDLLRRLLEDPKRFLHHID